MQTGNRSSRVVSIDILRGLVMVIMAIDHTRDFFHAGAMTDDPLNLATTTVPLYFTRWITHFCAPTFVFLSGVSAYLSSLKKTRSQTAAFLIKRGLWLIFVELIIITFGFTFNPLWSFLILQVIWAIGTSMIILGICSLLPYRFILIIGLVLFFGHNITDHLLLPQTGAGAQLWRIFLTAHDNIIPLGVGRMAADFYAILPWTGVMMTGYAAGKIFTNAVTPERRQKILMIAGMSLCALFIILRFINIYGDPVLWNKADGILGFLNTTKYPPSLQYLCMTLGPSILLLSALEGAKNRIASFFTIYGKVPFFYYVLHFYLLHILVLIAFYITGHSNSEIVDQRSPFLFRPAMFGFSLPVVYLIWAFVVLALYYPCRWFMRYKETHRQWWLSYL